MKRITLAVLSLALLPACGQCAASPVVAQYKRALLPLFVGSYAGECSMQPGGARSRAAISVAADGAVSAPGLKSRAIMDADAMFMVSKQVSAGGIGFMASSERAPWIVSMQKLPAPAASFTSGAASIACAIQSGAGPAAASDVYPLVARFFVAAARSMKCSDNSPTRKTYRVAPAATSVTIGEHTYSLLRKDAGEMVLVEPGRTALAYQMQAPDGEMIEIVLDQAGALSTFSVSGSPSKVMFICFADQGL
jgi:hypothetical protein